MPESARDDGCSESGDVWREYGKDGHCVIRGEQCPPACMIKRMQGLELDKEAASSRVAALEQRIAELEANLVRYGDHEVINGTFACASFDKQPCNCGFTAALARLREVKG